MKLVKATKKKQSKEDPMSLYTKEALEKELKENPDIKLTTIGVYHIPNTKLVAAFKMETQNGQVVSIEVPHDPDLKPIAIDNLKVLVVHEYMSEEFAE